MQDVIKAAQITLKQKPGSKSTEKYIIHPGLKALTIQGKIYEILLTYSRKFNALLDLGSNVQDNSELDRLEKNCIDLDLYPAPYSRPQSFVMGNGNTLLSSYPRGTARISKPQPFCVAYLPKFPPGFYTPIQLSPGHPKKIGFFYPNV